MSGLMDYLTGIVAGGLAVYWSLRPRLRPTVEPPAAAPDAMAALFLQLDRPLSREALVARARDTLEQYACDEDVGLFVIAAETDGTTQLHASASPKDIRFAIAALLDVHDKEAPQGRTRTNGCRRLLGIKGANA